MGGGLEKVKEKAKEMKQVMKKGVRVVGISCRKGWYKVKHLRSSSAGRLTLGH